MRMRTIFCPTGKFESTDEFLSYLETLLSKSKGDYDASFYLFPEDILGVYDRLAGSGLTAYSNLGKKHVLGHDALIFFITRLQAALGPRDFAIFSVYSSVGTIVMNSGFFVGKKQWFFDHKRAYTPGDREILGDESRGQWRIQSKLMAKSAHCIRSGDICIKGLHLLVCADLALLPKMRLSGRFLCFIPAMDLHELQIRQSLANVTGAGRVFITDEFKGRAWAFSFSGKEKRLERLKFEGKPIYFEFDG